MELSGAEIVIRSLAYHNLDTFFGYQGSCIMQIMDCLYNNKKAKHILVRHEQGAVHAACGYAQFANKPGVVFVTSGPGATNTVSGIADAYCSGTPLLIITGQVSSHLLGTDAFQEADMISITAPITKWNHQIHRADQIAQAVTKALQIAVSDRPGPVLLDITKDAQTGKAEYTNLISPINCSCVTSVNTTISNYIQKKTGCQEVMKAFQESGKNMVLVVDKTPNDFYTDAYFGSNKVLRSGTFHIPGFGLPAAIGASYATTNQTICLVAGAREFQSTFKEAGVILQQKADLKMIVFTNATDNRFEIENPDFIRLMSAYGIKGDRVDKKEHLSGSIQKMLNSTKSYLVEIREDLCENP